MASVTRKVGNSGKLSPYWRAKFKGSDARTIVWLTTKCRDAKKALKVAQIWEQGARLAAGAELNQPLAQKLVKDVERVYPHPDTMEITRRLVDEFLRDSLGGQDFTAFAGEWLASRKLRTSPNTFAKYKGVLGDFLEFLPERRRVASVTSISVRELRQFRDAEILAGKSPKTVKVALQILAVLFNSARREGLISNNPVQDVEAPRGEGEKRIPFDEEQTRAILAVCDTEWRGMVLVAVHAGPRLGDCARLTWENIDPQDKTMTYVAQKTGKKTVVVLHPDVLTYLESLHASDNPSQPLFPSLFDVGVDGHDGLSHRF